MFLQVGVPQNDQKCLRFLWGGGELESTSLVEVYQYTRHVFGARDSPTCANYALQRTAVDNKADFPNASAVMYRDIYMDDLLHASTSADAACSLGKDLITVCSKGGFKLTKWLSNVPEVASKLNIACGNVVPVPSSGLPASFTDHAAHVLGLKWDFNADTLVVSRGTDKPLASSTITQRVVLGRVSSVFDPIGLIAPVTISARLLLKAIWKRVGQDWDTPLTDDFTQLFLDWLRDLPLLSAIAIPRTFFPFEPADVQLHVFGDASQEAFCAVAFVRAQADDGSWHVSFVVGKARVAPMKCLTVPKLELQASLLASRIRQQLASELSLAIGETFLWTDSETVLKWLRSADAKHPIFVANRVSEILEHSTIDEWHHVPGEMNPADCATRGFTPSQLLESTWLTGPAFLKDATLWPPDKSPQQSAIVTESFVSNTATRSKSLLVDWSKFSKVSSLYSSFDKLKRILALVLRLLPKSKRLPVSSRQPSADELARAERSLFFLAQRESFSEEIGLLSADASVKPKSRLAPMSPFIGFDGLVRSKGRLSRLTSIPFESRHPVLLDSRHPAIHMFLQAQHCEHHHEGTEYLRSVICQRFWILRLRSSLQSIKHSCKVCRRFSPEVVTPEMADLPVERLGARQFPFSFVGVDYFGPFSVTVNRRQQKRWCFLFTCLTVRAVHVEIVSSMSADSCLQAIFRFIARRGKPLVIGSDNGTNFVGADRELREMVDSWNTTHIESVAGDQGHSMEV